MPLRIRLWYAAHYAAQRLAAWVWKSKLAPWHLALTEANPDDRPTQSATLIAELPIMAGSRRVQVDAGIAITMPGRVSGIPTVRVYRVH